MFELWIVVDCHGMYKVYASDDLLQVRAVEYEQALSGAITEIRLKEGAL